MRYEVRHTTIYDYEESVSSSYGEAHLLPRELPTQRVLSRELTVDPEPEDRHDRVDWFGNPASYFSIQHPHDRLEVTASSTVEVLPREVTDEHLRLSAAWEDVVAAARDTEVGRPDRPGIPDLASFRLASPSVPTNADLADYAAPSFEAGAPSLDAVRDLAHRINQEFAFVPGATSVTTTVAEVLKKREGVCQDFAHLMIGALRSVGLPARYVSGYLETDPPPGMPRLEGADVSHAWVGVWLGGLGWVDVDPTNDRFVGERHVTTAWGRDFRDVTPLKGVIFSDGGTDELTVTVDVKRIATPPQSPSQSQSQSQR